MVFADPSLTASSDAAPPADALLSWYATFQRDLPWRRERNPYHSWICEVMSQQTTMAVVVPRFLRFIEALPTVHALASCDDALLRSLWSGLGYYARARNLRKGALHITQARGGRFPTSSSEWLDVPGVGPYTASVIASITCGEPLACVDGNVVRVVSRLLALSRPEDVWTGEGQRRIQSFAQELLDASPRAHAHPGDFNQAMMELGATLCTKHSPKCDACPLWSSCAARRAGVQATCPPAKPRKAKKAVTLHALAFVRVPSEAAGTAPREAQVLLVERGRGFLKGTRGWPLAPHDAFDERGISLSRLPLASRVAALPFSHTITHHALTVEAHVCVVPSAGAPHATDVENFAAHALGAQGLAWLPLADVASALSTSLDTKAWSALAAVLPSSVAAGQRPTLQSDDALSSRQPRRKEACQNP